MSFGGDFARGYQLGLTERELEDKRERQDQPTQLRPLAFPKVGSGRSSRRRGRLGKRPENAYEERQRKEEESLARANAQSEFDRRLRAKKAFEDDTPPVSLEKSVAGADAYQKSFEDRRKKIAQDEREEAYRTFREHVALADSEKTKAALFKKRFPKRAHEVDSILSQPMRDPAALDKLFKSEPSFVKMGLDRLEFVGDGRVRLGDDYADEDSLVPALLGIMNPRYEKPVGGGEVKTDKTGLKDIFKFLSDTSKTNWDAAIKMATKNDAGVETVDDAAAWKYYSVAQAQMFKDIARFTPKQAKAYGINSFGKVKKEIEDSSSPPTKKTSKPSTPIGVAAYYSNVRESDSAKANLREFFPKIADEVMDILGWDKEIKRPPKRGILAVKKEPEENELS